MGNSRDAVIPPDMPMARGGAVDGQRVACSEEIILWCACWFFVGCISHLNHVLGKRACCRPKRGSRGDGGIWRSAQGCSCCRASAATPCRRHCCSGGRGPCNGNFVLQRRQRPAELRQLASQLLLCARIYTKKKGALLQLHHGHVGYMLKGATPAVTAAGGGSAGVPHLTPLTLLRPSPLHLLSGRP